MARRIVIEHCYRVENTLGATSASTLEISAVGGDDFVVVARISCAGVAGRAVERTIPPFRERDFAVSGQVASPRRLRERQIRLFSPT